MKVTEVVNDIYNITINDLENMFNVYKDNDDNYFYNINSTLYLDVDPEDLKVFVCDYDMPWPIISYRLYKTTRLTWLLLKLNKISMEDSLKSVPATSEIYYLDIGSVSGIIENL